MDIRVFTGSVHPKLAVDACRFLSMAVSSATVGRFTDGEVRVELGESVRGVDAFVIQPTPAPADNWFELFLLIDALRRSSAERITAVLSYCGFACQDRKDKPHVPISVELVGQLVQRAGADRVVLLDLHNETTIAFFGRQTDHLYASTVLVPACRELDINSEKWVVVASDVGRAERTRGFAKRILPDLPVAVIDKRRSGDTQTQVMNIIGDIKGRNLLLFDDMIRTAGTVIGDTKALKAAGAERIISCVTG